MKVYIIKACADSPFKAYKKYMAAPPQSIFSMAACTPKDVDIQMTDETVDMSIQYATDADIIVIFFSTPDAYRAYEIAEKFSALAKTVILSGLHVKFNQGEALNHCDSIIVGECENVWEDVLSDYKYNKLKRKYESDRAVDMATLNPYPTNIISSEKYNHIWSVVISRGCENHCTYCLVNRYFDSIRYRPIDNIISEIKQSGAKLIELHADNLTADRSYAKELFERLIPLNIKWFGETTVNFADDEELVRLAAKSGLSYLLLGIETPSAESLEKISKGFIDVSQIKKQIKVFHKYNIMIDSAMMFGLDGQKPSIFEETVHFVRDIDLDIAHGITPIPFPGTKFYEELSASGRIISKDWSEYDGRHLVYRHEYLTPSDIDNGIKFFETNVYTLTTAYRYYKFIFRLGLNDIK